MNSRLWNLYFENNTNNLLIIQLDAPTEMEAVMLGKEKFKSLVLIHNVWQLIDYKETVNG